MGARGRAAELSIGGGLGVAYVEGEDALPSPSGDRDRVGLPGRGHHCAGDRRAGTVDRGAGGCHALHGRHDQGDPRRAHLRVGRRRHVGQPATGALRLRLRGLPTAHHGRGPAGSRDDRGQALRVRRRARSRRAGTRRRGRGDMLATPVTGAYGHSMGSNYNKVLRPAVVFVREARREVVRRRPTRISSATTSSEPVGGGSGRPRTMSSDERRPGGCAGVRQRGRAARGAHRRPRATIAARTGLHLEVARIGARPHQAAADHPPGRPAHPDAGSIVDDPGIDLVELIGGSSPRDLILTALKAGKPVITGNKELLAKHGAGSSRRPSATGSTCSSRRRWLAASRSSDRCASRWWGSASPA